MRGKSDFSPSQKICRGALFSEDRMFIVRCTAFDINNRFDSSVEALVSIGVTIVNRLDSSMEALVRIGVRNKDRPWTGSRKGA